MTNLTSSADREFPKLFFQSSARGVSTLVVHEGVFAGMFRSFQNFSVAVVVAHHGALGKVLKTKMLIGDAHKQVLIIKIKLFMN
jgi:hypothetical protein